MNGYIIFALAFGPAVFWLWFFYKKDILEPEPKSLVIRMFVYGMALVAPASLLEEGLGSSLFMLPDLWITILLAPVIEESLKYLLVRHSIYTYREFNEPMDGIVYAAAVALGFASLENLHYVGRFYFSATTAAEIEAAASPVLQTAAIRAVFSVPAHVLFSTMWGFALGAAKFMDHPAKANSLVRGGLWLGVIMHAIFNLFASFPMGLLLLITFMYIAWRMVRERISLALLNSPFVLAARHGRSSIG